MAEIKIDVLRAGKLLRHCFCIHRTLVRSLAGWLIAAPRYEDKHVFGYHLWEHAQHAAAVRTRLSELRGGLADANMEPAFAVALVEAVHASNTEEFIEGAYLELLPRIIRAYEYVIEWGDPVANAPELSLARRAVSELRAQANWATDRLPERQPSAWRLYMRSKLAQAPDLDGLRETSISPCARPHDQRFERPKTIQVDPRLTRGGLMPVEQRQQLPYREELIEQFKVFFNEFYAAAILASVIFDAAVTDVPFEFLYDAAHQCWDEIRHSQFGSIRLAEMGVAPDCYDPVLYEQVEALPFLHRFCHLTLNLEPYFMSRKKPRVAHYQSAGDARSQLFADVDWSDEINHVRYGQKWVQWFLQGDARDLTDIKREIDEHLARQAHAEPSLAGQFSPF